MTDERFAFGANWGRYLTHLSEKRIIAPEVYAWGVVHHSGALKRASRRVPARLRPACVVAVLAPHELTLSLERLRTCGGDSGCNEFVFRRA